MEKTIQEKGENLYFLSKKSIPYDLCEQIAKEISENRKPDTRRLKYFEKLVKLAERHLCIGKKSITPTNTAKHTAKKILAINVVANYKINEFGNRPMLV